ncbi:5-oxoprolinase subunit PxpA [uncultured Croceitalea sp.]|uniref:5-oxoprolinase subunit PxpA n=1 Tax=uncultured Croceitalea sp. TaxID=1798908 RepID=UPI003305BA36
METYPIDINCDLGEGMGNEKDLMPYISSCNIACGGHAGDEATIAQVMQLAKEYQVKVGAHPSYPDKENFGRIAMDITSEALKESIREQLVLFVKVAERTNVKINHIKPHGALYNAIAKEQVLAEVFLEAIRDYVKKSILYVPFGSIIANLAINQGFQVQYEAFADRNYNRDLSLVSRKKDIAVITDPQEVVAHLLSMVKEGQVNTISGNSVTIKADTFCVHGDTPTALKILAYLSKELPKNQVYIKK